MECVHPGVLRGQQLALVHALELLVELQLALTLRNSFLFRTAIQIHLVTSRYVTVIIKGEEKEPFATLLR